MAEHRTWSTRLRLAVPISAAAVLATRGLSVAAQQATPAPIPESSFASMLSLIPATMPGSGEYTLLAMYADIAGQLEAVGLSQANTIEEAFDQPGFIQAISPLAIADPFASQALNLTRDLVGFDFSAIDQTMQAGEPPEMVTLLRGRFDQNAVAAAWTANGYKMIDVDGTQVASLFEDPKLDLDNPISRIVLNRMNNAAFLADGTLVYTASLKTMRLVIATAAGTEPSLAERVDVAALLAAGDGGIVTGALFEGAELSIANQLPPDLGTLPNADELLATPLAGETMPPVTVGLIGSTPGGPLPNMMSGTPVSAPPAHIVIRLLFVTPDSAETAQSVVEARADKYVSLITNEPFNHLFPEIAVTALTDENVLSIELTPESEGTIGSWMRILFARDLLFLAW